MLPYLARLGISHLYVSPILTARSGSMHGYDIVDHGRVNPELGGEDDLRRLVGDLRGLGMGLIVDIVPNHMAVGNHDNEWWMDVLRWGRESPYASFFDIDWNAPDPTLEGRILAPFLGKPYGDALDSAEIELRFDRPATGLHFAYYEHHFPLSPEEHARVLGLGGSALAPFAQLFYQASRGARGARREAFRRACDALAQAARDAAIGTAIDALVRLHDPRSLSGRETLHRTLERQHYRLAWWRTAPDEINWRRFFDVIDLAGLRVEDHAVFEATHRTILRLYEEGLIDGLRIDHVDGLADPRAYCRRLRQRLRRLASRRPADAGSAECYLVVEKILAPQEQLVDDWQVDGTTGYVFMNDVSALLHDPRGEEHLRALWTRFGGRSSDFAVEEESARRRIPEELFAASFHACALSLRRLARRDRATRDWTLGAVRRVLSEFLVHFPVYRTYADARGRSESDARIMREVVAAVQRTCRPADAGLVPIVDGWLGGTAPRSARSEAERRARMQAIGRFQQLTSPVAAKSVEDTALYRHGTLLSRNEVGGDPGQFALSVNDFHHACAERRRRFPRAMIATSTHDHKRGADLRARLAVLSEIPERWSEAVMRWSDLNAPRKPLDDGVPCPDGSDEYMLYQMLVGAWPFELELRDAQALAGFRDRILQWQQKALREAKRHSEWFEPNLPYEEACRDFLMRLFEPDARDFLEDLRGFAGEISAAGALNGLAQSLLHLTCAGVPDFYQGCEWWDLSLVDPDNRRPVDFAARARALGEPGELRDALRAWRDGRIKQQLIHALLAHRSRHPGLYAEGSQEPLRVLGERSGHLVAFARRVDRQALVVLAPRLPGALLARNDSLRIAPEDWFDTRVELPESVPAPQLTNLFLQRRVAAPGREPSVTAALFDLPFAVLTMNAE